MERHAVRGEIKRERERHPQYKKKRIKKHETKSMTQKAWHKRMTQKTLHKKHETKSITQKVWHKKYDTKSMT